jgi:hypothetical protein
MTPIAATADIGQASQVVNTWKPQGTGAFDANGEYKKMVLSWIMAPSQSF